MSHTFISYAREDAKFALKLAKALRAAGVEIWLDQFDLPSGARWDRAVQAALETCARFLIILSPAAIGSENVQDEIAVALDENKTIVPVLFQACKTPLRLRRLQHVDFTGDFQTAFAELMEDLQTAPRGNEPTPASAPAVTPQLRAVAQASLPVDKRSALRSSPEKMIAPPEGMALIPAGWFLMGGDKEEREKPIHKVYVDAFFMDKYQVTVAQYQRFLKATQANNPPERKEQIKFPKRSVVNVSWNDAQAYAQWAGKRLHTEAEWEYAGRGGYTGLPGEPRYEYPWGDEIDASKANYDSNGLKDVGSYPANGFDLFDMAGNVWDWCADWFDENYYKNSPERNPCGPAQAEYCVLRGGSWNSSPQDLRCAYRLYLDPTVQDGVAGFRCAQDALF